MKIIIDIPEEMYDWLDNGFPDEDDAERLWQVVKNGTPLFADGDLISRDYTIQQIQKAKESNYNFNYNTLIDFIKALPSAEKTAVITVTDDITNAEIVKKLKTYCPKVEIDKSAEKTAEWLLWTDDVLDYLKCSN